MNDGVFQVIFATFSQTANLYTLCPEAPSVLNFLLSILHHPRFRAIFACCLPAKVPFPLSLTFRVHELMRFAISFSLIA